MTAILHHAVKPAWELWNDDDQRLMLHIEVPRAQGFGPTVSLVCGVTAEVYFCPWVAARGVLGLAGAGA